MLAVAALLAGCKGGDDKHTTSTTTRTVGKSPGTIVQGYHVLAVLKVHESEYKLRPRTIGLEVPGYFGLQAINDGKVPHALAVEGHGVERHTPTLKPGRSATIAVYFKEPGVYKLYCPLGAHRARGMTGTIRVK